MAVDVGIGGGPLAATREWSPSSRLSWGAVGVDLAGRLGATSEVGIVPGEALSLTYSPDLGDFLCVHD